MDLEVEHLGVKQSMLKALRNVMPRHLRHAAQPERRAAPSDSAALPADEATAPSLIQIQH
jgi:hypothetical protein